MRRRLVRRVRFRTRPLSLQSIPAEVSRRSAGRTGARTDRSAEHVPAGASREHPTTIPIFRRATSRSVDARHPARWWTLAFVLIGVGFAIFLFGVFKGDDRAWHAYHVNWLFFTTFSSAGVVFVALQRITTARWSRPVVRMLEGYASCLPVAFLLMGLIFLGRAIFPWAHGEIHARRRPGSTRLLDPARPDAFALIIAA